MRRRAPRTMTAAVPVLLAGALALSACTSGDPGSESTTAATEAAEEPASTQGATAPVGYAFSGDNCGTEVSLSTAPERIVTVKSAMTELVLALGAGDLLVGTAYQDGPVPDEDPLSTGEVATGSEQDVATILAGVPDLGERMPTHEGVLSVEPDLVLAGWESTFTADAAGERQSFADLGITTFVAPSACTKAPYAPVPLTWDDVFDEIDQVGDLLNRSQQAELVLDRLNEDLTSAEDELRDRQQGDEPEAGPTVLWWSSGSDTPYVGAGQGAPQLVMETAGLTNIAADLPGGWGPYSWEAAAAADPDYLVLVDSAWNSAEHKKELLAANPVTAAMSAVANQRYLVVPFPATEAGIRTVGAVRDLIDQVDTLPLS